MADPKEPEVPADAPSDAAVPESSGGPPTETAAAEREPQPPEGTADSAHAGAPAEPGEPGSGEGQAAEGQPGELDPKEGEGPPRGPGRSRRTADEDRTPPPPERLDGAVEALLLASGDVLSAERLRDLLGLPSAVHVRDALLRIRERWQAAGLAVEIQEVAGGLRVVTRPEFAEYVRRLSRRPAVDRLSAGLLETLSIIAYKQPVARVEVERIRGVQAGEALRGLLDRHLIKVVGRSDQPGRPLLYATTRRFLEVFGLKDLKDLPTGGDLQKL